MLAEYTREELAAGLDRVVKEILLAADIDHPPVDAFAIAEALGITVAVDDVQSGRARYVRLSNRRSGNIRPLILLRTEPRRERRHWALAHEIGEHVACRVFACWGVDPCEAPSNCRELVANQLACRLLLPSDWFALDGAACNWNLMALKARYNTASHELIARRMLDCRPPVIMTIFDQGCISFRRSNVPGRAPSPSSDEMICQQQAHRTGQPSCIAEAAVNCWPVHEEHWRREILRRAADQWEI